MKKILLLLLQIFLVSSLTCALAITKKDVQTLVEKHQYEEAIDALRTLMKQSAYAKDGDCNKLLGQSLCLTGHYKEALPHLQAAIRQNRRSGAQWYLAITLQHLYDFQGALDAIEAYRPVLKSDLWLERADSLEIECQQGLRALNHVEDVEIIDSLYVSKSSFFSHYKLGPESGRVMSDEQNGLFFENQAADYRIYASDGTFYECYKIQDAWEDPHPLRGIGSEDFRMIMPFMRTDGETLYFACDSTPGIGGLDIYKTRFNSEEGEFYQAERLGMPFNSPFDDYMMAIDETHQVGWWATERGSDSEHVLIYLFKLSDNPEFLDEPDVPRARIDRIADSWKSADGYSELLHSIATIEQRQEATERVMILINDRIVYDSPEQFKNQDARSLYEQCLKMQAVIEEKEILLKELRALYAGSSPSKKSQVADQISLVEEELYSLYRNCHQMEKKFRSLEAE